MKKFFTFLILLSYFNAFSQSQSDINALKLNSKNADLELQNLVNAKNNLKFKEPKKINNHKIWKEVVWLGAAGFVAYQGLNLMNDGKVVLGKDLIYLGGITYATHLTFSLFKKEKPKELKNPLIPELDKQPIKTILTPILSINSIKFTDKNNNDRIDADEQCNLNFSIKNNGNGEAKKVKVLIKNKRVIQGLDYPIEIILNNILPENELQVNIPISGLVDLVTDTAIFNISFEEEFGFPPDEFEVNISTKEFIRPNIQVVDHTFLSENGFLRLGYPIQLAVMVQNIGQGIAENVVVDFIQPTENVYLNGLNNFKVDFLKPNEKKELVFEFIPNKLYKYNTIPISVNIDEKYKKYGFYGVYTATVDEKSTRTPINFLSTTTDKVVEIEIASLTSDVDKNIPLNLPSYPNRYALIIGNEDYASRQMGLNTEVNVAFALNDAKVFKEYAIKTLGVEEKNCFLLLNATAGEMSQKIALLSQLLNKIGSKGELIFYYAGHGFPDDITKSSYLMPVDVSATNLNSAMKLSDIYDKFSQNNSSRVTFFLDACFTGAGRMEGLIASRGVKIKPKAESFGGNMVSFTATSQEQTALPYTEKQHGMFTYFLLKKIQETRGNVTYSELQSYINYNVSIQSLKTNQKAQDPIIYASPSVETTYGTWKLK